MGKIKEQTWAQVTERERGRLEIRLSVELKRHSTTCCRIQFDYYKVEGVRLAGYRRKERISNKTSFYARNYYNKYELITGFFYE